MRPGQSKPSACCGAAQLALKKLRAGVLSPKDPKDFDPLDYQQEWIEQIFLRNKPEILLSTVEAKQFIAATEVMFREMQSRFLDLANSIDFEENRVFVFGGILINEDQGKGSSIALRSLKLLETKHLKDLAPDFMEKSEAKFKLMDNNAG